MFSSNFDDFHTWPQNWSRYVLTSLISQAIWHIRHNQVRFTHWHRFAIAWPITQRKKNVMHYFINLVMGRHLRNIERLRKWKYRLKKRKNDWTNTKQNWCTLILVYFGLWIICEFHKLGPRTHVHIMCILLCIICVL